MLSDRCSVCPSATSVYCGQTVGSINMKRLKPGMKVGLSHIVLDGDPAPSPKKVQSPPIFSPRLLWPNGWMDQDATWYGGRPRPRRHCVDGDPAPLKKGHTPPIFGPCLLWPNGWMDQDAIWYGGRPWP